MLEALRQADFDIDTRELERFMKKHHMKPERPWRPLPLRGLPAWLGGSRQEITMRRSKR